MKEDKVKKNIFLLVLSSTFLISCSTKDKIIDIDLSNLPKPKINNNVKKELDQNQSKKFVKDLVPFKNKEQLLSQFKFGKKDPFSLSESKENKFSSNFKLKGFLNTEVKKYVFVMYLGEEGTLSEQSIGGINTKLLPKGAKIINIDSKAMRLTINFENENFVFEL